MYKNISINSLYLDSKNPRHIPIDRQDKIIDYLIKKEDIKSLAKDIAEKGLTNPLDIIGITKEDNKNIVLEGNRRVCAIKLLLKPSLAPEKHQKYFESLRNKMVQPIKKVPVHKFSNREESSNWLSTLHSSSSKTSRKSWSTEQKTRFMQEQNNKPEHSAALSILRFSLQNQLITQDKSQKVITTITRMLSSPEVREAFGIVTGVREKNIEINITKQEFANILKQYFSDFDDKSHNIGSRSNKVDRLKYIDYLKQINKIPASRLDSPIPLTPVTLPTVNPDKLVNSSKSAQTKSPTKSINNKNEKGLIDYDIKIPVTKIESIYLELKNKLKVTESPYAVAALLRALVEQSCDYFLLKNNNTSILFNENGKTEKVLETSNLRNKILGIAQLLEKKNHLENKELATLTNECAPKKEGVGTLNLLNSVLHNYAHNITSEQVIAAHNNLRPFILAIWNKFLWPSDN